MRTKALAVALLGCTACLFIRSAGAAEDPPSQAAPSPGSSTSSQSSPVRREIPPGSSELPPAPSESAKALLLSRPLPNPLQIGAPPEVLRIDYFGQPDLLSQTQGGYFDLEHRVRIALSIVQPVKKRWRLGAKLEYEYTFFNRAYQDVHDSENAYSISIRPIVVYSKNRWASIFEFGPAIATTFQSPFSRRDWRLKLFSAVMYTLRPTLALRFGIFGVIGFSGNVFLAPGLGLAWRPRPNLLLDLYLPLWVHLYYTPTPLLTFFFRIMLDVVTFDETLQGSNQTVIRDSPVIMYPRTGVGLRFTAYRGVHAEVASGLSTESTGIFFEKNLQMGPIRMTSFVQASIVLTSELFVRLQQPAN